MLLHRESRWRLLAPPGRATVFRSKDCEASIYRIAKNDAMLPIREGEGIEKSFRVGIGEEQTPVAATIAGLIQAGLVAGPDAQQVRCVRIESHHRAEIQRSRRPRRCPRASVRLHRL